MRRNLPDPAPFLERAVDGDFRIVELIGKGCNALVFRGYSDTLLHSVAYKIIPMANLAPGETWQVEARKANSLQDPCVVKCIGLADWRTTDKCVVLKYEYVEGTSLKDFLKKSSDEITIPLTLSFLKTVLRLFFEMKKRNLQHGDLHAGNILVTKPSAFQWNSTESFKVTDFGIGGLTTSQGVLDDYGQLAVVLTQLLECIDYQQLSPEEKYTFNILNDHFCAKHLRETDATRDPLARNPEELLKRLEQMPSEYAAKAGLATQATLISPFDYLSCEQIGQQHSLLQALYSEKFLGISEIESANNLVVTGPRGCGKSTVFRSLALRHHSIPPNDHSQSPLRYFGIFYHCQDLYFKFPRYAKPEKLQAIDLPIHYLTCRLLIEILDTIRQLASSLPSSLTREREICRVLWTTLDLPRPALPDVDTYAQLSATLKKQCLWAAEKHRFAATGTQPVDRCFGPDKFPECCSVLQTEITELRTVRFYCFVDDYSIPHVSVDLQKSLNRLLMQRNAFCFFKMATESPVSFEASDIDGKPFTEGREFEVLNLGLIYLRGDKERKLEFLDDVFARRFKAVSNYPVTSLSELIGDGDGLSFNAVAEKFASGEKLESWGRATLGMMCSGDIHQLITLVRKMVADVGGTTALSQITTTPRLPPKEQNKAIRAHAGDFLQSLAENGEHGERLRKIVFAFGSIAHSYLKYRRSKNEEGQPRYQASRIELHEVPILEGEAKDIYEELLRYSVFIQDPRGKSLRGNLVPRLYLRRFLIPHFNLTFSLRDSVLLEASEFVELLLDPARLESRKRLKAIERVDDTPDDQQSKFDFGHGGTA